MYARPAKISRRNLMRGAVLLSGAGALSACARTGASGMSGMNHGSATVTAMDTPYLNTGRDPSTSFKPDLDIALTAQPGQANILPGKATRVWRYDAKLVSGDATQLQTLGDGFLGPLIRARTGQKVRLRFTNGLPGNTPSNIHWHGLRPPNEMDGHPLHVIGSGKAFAYEFEISDPAMTAWFHPHPHGDTGRQVYMGLAGMFVVSDEAERALGLPTGEYDLPLVIQDRVFDSDNQLLYFGQGMMSGPMDQMMGFYGDRVLVNGRADATLDVAMRPYRLRVLNGSNARIYKLAWSDGTPITVIGTDNGLLERPVVRSYVMLAPGERAELWVDFSTRPAGEHLTLISDHFAGAENVPVPARLKPQMNGVEQMLMHGGALELGAKVNLLTVRINKASLLRGALPATLVPLPFAPVATVARRRTFAVSHKAMMWMFNGRVWDGGVAEDERVKQGDVEEWVFINSLNLGESMDPLGMAHPIHMHGVHFKVIERKQTLPEMNAFGYDAVNKGWLDEGIKDTFMMMPGEQVTVRVRFAQSKGKYVYHCHNLEHEDQGLMRNYEVT